MKARKKRGMDVPPKIRAFINSVTTAALENIEVPLSDFAWDYEKGDFHQWCDLFHLFDSFFDKYIKSRKDLQLDGDILEADDIFPKNAVLQILRVTRIILENCANKYLYSSHENVTFLLASTDPDIVIAALQTLAALVRKQVQSNRTVRWHGDPVMNGRLFSLSQGWGGKEEGLGLLSCAIENGCDADASKLGSTLHFEFYADGSVNEDLEVGERHEVKGLQVIHISDMHLRPEGDLHLLKQLSDEYQVPLRLRFSLLTRLRFARAFNFLPLRRQYICIRLLAFTVLLQSNPDHEDLTTFFVNEPEFVNELVSLLHAENSVPENIRVLAVLALAAQAQDRPRQSNVLSVVSAGGHRGILPSLVQKAVVSVTTGLENCSAAFVEALLSLVTVLVSSSSGCAALREAGLIPTLLPLLKDLNPQHVDLVSSAVHILEAFMDYSNPAGTLFRDLGGLDDTIVRLQFEVSQVEQVVKCQREDLQVSGKGKASMIEDADPQQIAAGTQSEALIPYRQRLLLKALLRAIALGTYASGNTARLHGSEENALPACLCSIFRHAKEFGGGVFSLAASVMSDLINKDPTCFPVLHAAGLPAAFLDSINAGVLPSSDAVGCIPHALDALSLNPVGLQAVKDYNAIHCFVKIFTSKTYLRALAGDTPGTIASGLDELMRHAPSLRGSGIDACIEILKTIAVVGGAIEEINMPAPGTDPENTELPTPMDTDLEEKTSASSLQDDWIREQITDSPTESSQPNLEIFLPECISNSVQLLETILQNADSCRVFIEKKGIEALLQLFTLPHLPLTFGGSSTAYNIYVSFRAFSSQHAPTLTKAVCTALRDHLKRTLETLGSLIHARLSDLESEIRIDVVRKLSAIECFLSLTSFLVKSLTPMLAELNTSGADVLTDIGKVHRWVLWQISLVDDTKVESRREDESGNSSSGTTGTNDESREIEDDQDTFPIVRYINPISSRSGHTSRWNPGSDLLPLLQMDHGLDRRARREHVATAEILSQVARLGRLARHARTARADIEGTGAPAEGPPTQESSKRKSLDTLIYEMMMRLVATARGLYVALGKAMIVPSRRRDDPVTVSQVAKSIASSLANVLHENLSFDGCVGTSQSDLSVSVKCRYLGKVVEDLTAVIMDSRRRTCNTVMVGSLHAHGAIKQLLTTFEATSQLLWTALQTFGLPMETETNKIEGEKVEDKQGGYSWLLDTVQSYARLMEHLVTSSLLLTPPSMAQLLVQPVVGGSVPMPRDPEAFVLTLQSQVLEVVLPVWNHPMFSQCNPNLITSICSIIMQVYSGVTDLKIQRGTGSGTAGSRHNGPPPDESAILMIVEMGFSRLRAEEALRRVGINSVEMAMEWLFSHPEETSQEDDELARALALSLGNGSESRKEDANSKGKDVVIEEVGSQPPPVENMLSTCMNLLNSTDTVAFPLTDLMVTLCMRNKGQDRSKVISYLIQQLKLCKVEESGSDVSPLSTISHMLALILVEDSIAREVAAENGLVGIALDILTCFNASEGVGERTNVPKWVTALLLVLDHMLQYKPQTDSEAPNGSAGGTMSDESVSEGTGLSPDQTPDLDTSRDMSHKKPWETILGKPAGYMTDHEQRRTMTVACNFLNMKLPASTVQAVLQLCARLTKAHSVAMQFLEAGGLSALLSLPRSCLFSGFNSVAAAIIRHLLEDPQTLQQAMESEIRHTLAATLNRHNGRVSPRMFLTAMAPVVSRDPAVFMQAAAVVCQIESIGGRLCVVLAKEKEKEKEREREKEKEKEKVPEKEKDKAKAMSVPSDETNSMASLGNGITKAADSLAKPMKGHKKVSQSFSHVLEQLLDVILHFVPPVKANNANSPGSATAAMEVDEVTLKDKGKSKLDENLKSDKTCMSENSAALAKVTFILNLTTEILLMYFSAVSVVLRRDTESSQGRVPFQAGGEVVGHGGLLHHVLHRLLPYSAAGTSEKLTEDEWREKLSSKAGHFLMAICVRSIEGRRRVFSEVAKSLSAFASSHEMVLEEASKPPDKKVRAFVDLINAILASHTSSGSAQAPGVSAEMAKAVLDAGMVQALTLVLQVTDLDHPDAPKLVNGIVKALEALTRAASAGDQASGAEANISKKETSNGQRADVANGQSSENGRQEDHHTETRDETVTDSVPADLQTAIRAMRALVGGDSSRDGHMDNDMSLDRDNPEDVHLRAEEEEFMNDAAEDSGDLEGVTAAAISFRMEHGTEDDLGEDDDDDEEDMDGDGGDDDEEDEDEEDEEEDDEDDLEEDEVAHLSHPDTDVEDHEDHDLEDEYDEDMAEEEEDEDDDWRENRIIEVRWRDSLTGLDHVQVLGHAGGSNFADFPMDPFQGLNIDDLFGAFRRIGGTDRRRAPAYRPFLERSSSERIRTFQHPLLTRPTLATGMGSSGVAGSSLWTSTGNIGRETEALLGGGMDVTHFYMYDGPMLGEHANDGLFGDRAIGGQAPSFFEFSMDPIYRMGRRGGRADGRFSNWTDDGQPQGGAHAAAVAQAIEEQFISQLGSLSPAEGQPSSQPTDVDHPSTLGGGGGGQSEHTENMGLEQEAAAQIPQQNAMEHQVNRAESEQLNGGSSVSVLNDSAGQAYGLTGEVLGEQNCHTDIDVHMQDERSEPLARDVEAASQDSSGSGATVGESLRSLEVEIGSADGHDENDRHAGPDRLNAGENPPSGRGVLGRSLVSDSRVRHSDTDEDMDGAPIVGQDEEGRAQVPADLPHAQGSASGEGEQRDDQEGATQTNHSDANMNSIDPAFLEALPEDLRAEVLASQQTQPARTANHQASNMEDIDPEFLAALPPDIQAEVLAQQQAQRFLQAQQVEGQPVDMDSASIIATFPVELREEVLLTSSEAVLAALPPALLAEARLLRERAMNQYHARSLFGGAHRLGSRRNNVGASTRGPTAIDRAVGGGSSFVAGRGPSGVLGGGSKGNEADGKPLVDIAALKAMLRLLRLAQPLGKGLLQRLLLNLCVNSTTRATLVQLLLDMLRPDAEGCSMPISSTDAALSHRLYGCQWNVVYARPQLSDGVPPLVSRRVLEILTYLARNSLVANLLLYYEPVNDTALESVSHRSPEKAKEKGKAKLVDGEMLPEVSIEKPKGEVPLVLFLKLLNQPLYSRSSAHLEQVMGLLEVITSNAGVMIDLQTNSKPVDGVTPSEGVNIDSEQDGSLNPEGAATLVSVAPDDGSIQPQVAGACLETETPRPMIISESVLDHEDSEPSTSGSKQKTDPTAILMSLPKQELRHLCLLLTCEGLSDLAYTRVSEVLKKLASVAPLHRSLFISELADAAQRLSESAMSELQNLGDAEAVVLSTTSMVGGAILRVLLALSALTSGSGMKEKGQDNLLEKEQEESLSVVRDLNAALEPLWQGLSVCVGKIEGKLVTASAFSTPSSSATVAAGVPGTGGVVPPLPPGTQRVLPFIESFFVLCDKLRSVPSSSGQQELTSATACEIKEAANSASSSDSVPMPRSSSLQLRKADEKGVTFIRFADRHRRLLNAFVRQNPGLLEKSLSLLLKTPRLIDFDNKRSYFKSRIRQQHEQQHYAPLRISVRRAYVLEDSYNQLRMRTPDELKGRLTVQFQGEEGIDAGGLTREWYQLLSRVIFDKGALLFTTVGNESTFQPNPNSVYQTEHLSYFKFVGRVVSKALFDGQLLDVYFTRSFYKHILGVKVTYHDIEAIDPDFFKNLKWVLENDISDILGLTFSIDADEEKHILYEKTEVTDYELIPGGRNIRVTEENKHEYVDLVAEHRLTTAIRPQINAFLEGFNELVSRDLISIFNDKELELLISGLPEIDLDDLKANTEYSGYTAAAPVVQWFWEVVRGFSKEDMARLLQFITGTSKVPLEGFRALQGISGPQRFQIHKAYGAPERLPSAHTCFNQLDLPEYSSKEQLQERLLLAIHEGSEGFGFG